MIEQPVCGVITSTPKAFRVYIESVVNQVDVCVDPCMSLVRTQDHDIVVEMLQDSHLLPMLGQSEDTVKCLALSTFHMKNDSKVPMQRTSIP